MTQALHDAFTDLATEISPRLPAPAPARLDPWRRAVTYRRRRRVGSFAAAVVVVLLGALIISSTGGGLLGRTVTPAVPAPGLGSLPDRIFPTRSTILSVEQAPIGRAALVYDGPIIGQAGGVDTTRLIAVGADADVYRLLPAASAWALSPDGRTFAYLEAADEHVVVRSRLHLLSLTTGHARVVLLRDQGFGLSDESTLLWSPDGQSLVADVSARDGASGEAASSFRSREEVIHVATLAVSSREPATFQTLIGWYDDQELLVQLDGGETDLSGARTGAVQVIEAASGRVVQQLGITTGFVTGSTTPGWASMFYRRGLVLVSSQPPGQSFHNVRVTPLPFNPASQGGRGGPRLASFATPVANPPTDDERPLGWLSDSTFAVQQLMFLHPAEGYGGGVRLVVREVDMGEGQTRVLMSAGADSRVGDVELAADVLAGGRVRHAKAPQQPLLDLRTLAPAVGLWLHDWWLLILLPCLAVALLLFVRRRSRRLGSA